jgi:hypothetical protein
MLKNSILTEEAGQEMNSAISAAQRDSRSPTVSVQLIWLVLGSTLFKDLKANWWRVDAQQCVG